MKALTAIKAYRRRRKRIRRLKELYMSNDDCIFKAFDRTQSIFVHIPKNAGMSIGHSIYGSHLQWGHRTAIEIRSVLGSKKFSSYYKFAFVRNPWARLYSAYSFLKRGGMNAQDKRFANNTLIHYPTFKDLVYKGLNDSEIRNWIHFIPQYKFVCNNNLEILVDQIAYLENIKSEYENIADKLNIIKPLSFENVTNESCAYKSNYEEGMVDLVYQAYKTDIETFNYNFDGRKVVKSTKI